MKTTAVVKLVLLQNQCTVPENTNLLQDLFNSMRNLHLKLHVMLSNLWDIEDQLYRLWIEVNGVIQSYLHE